MAYVDIYDDFYIRGKGTRIIKWENDAQPVTIGSSSAAPAITMTTGALSITPSSFTLADSVITAASLTYSSGSLRGNGPMRIDINGLGNRYNLKWVAGSEGLVTVTASVLFSTDHDFELLGTNAVAADVTYYPEGGLLLGTHGASGDSSIILPWLSANKTPWTAITWGTDQETEWECHIQTTAAITAEIIWAGLKLTNTDVVATDNDSVYFRYEAGVGGGAWQTNYSIGGTDTTGTTSVVVAVTTQYHLKIAINSSRVAKFYINGTLVTTSTALTDATDLIPYIGIKSAAVAVKTVRVHGQAISRKVA